MKYFTGKVPLQSRFKKTLLDIGWHAFGDYPPHLDRAHFATLQVEDVKTWHYFAPWFSDVGNEAGECILIEVGNSAHSVMDLGIKRAERIAELIRGIILESRMDPAIAAKNKPLSH